MRTIGTLLLFSASLFADPNLLPLQDGNFWTYQQRGGPGSFTMRVGTPALIGGNVYYRLTGYVTVPLWVRFGDHDALYYRDEEKELDVLLTSFERSTRGAFDAPLRVCPTRGEVQPDSGSPSTLVVRYTVSGCADVGLQEEQFAANVGMVERAENSFTGPRFYDLVTAKVGNSTIQTAPGANFGVTLRKPDTGSGLLAILDLRITGPDPVTLHYSSSQQYDAIVRNDQGVAVWQWSVNRIFLQMVLDEITHGRSWTVQAPLTDNNGAALPAGKYSLEAWITSGHNQPQFAGTASFQIPEKE